MRILVIILLVESLLIVFFLLIIILIIQLLNIFSVLLVMIVMPLSWRVWLLSRIEIVLGELAIIVLLMLCIILIRLLPTRLFFWQVYLITYFNLRLTKINCIVVRFRHTLPYLSILDLHRGVIQLFFVRYTFLIDIRSRWGACVIHYGWRVIN